MKEKDYLISIIIPTKNRQMYCLETIKQIIALDIPSLEIVIQDNSDSNKLKDDIIKLNSKIINYHYTSGEISFVDNFNEAVKLANGEYYCVIGDDDGIVSIIYEVALFAKKNKVEAVLPGLNSVYIWPTNKPFIKKAENGYLCIEKKKKQIKLINPKSGLNTLMKTGGQKYQSLDIPRLYHGLIHYSVIDKIQAKLGKSFGGLSPDIYVSVAISLTATKCFKLSFPITISGISPKSGSADSATGKHTGQLKDAPHFKGNKNYMWDLKVPYIYTVETIWAETVLKALMDMNDNLFYTKFSVRKLDLICLANYPMFSSEIINHAKEFSINTKLLCVSKYFYKIITLINKILKRILRKPKSVRKIYNVKSINDALFITEKNINIHNLKKYLSNYTVNKSTTE